MIRWLSNHRYTPIGVDVGSRSVKLVQFTSDMSGLVDLARVEFHPGEAADNTPEAYAATVAQAITRGREGKNFRGKEVVLGLSDRDLFLQNIRVARSDGAELERVVMQEAAGRIPYNVGETEIRFLEMADVRQGDSLLREVLVFACHRPILERTLGFCGSTGLRPKAVDVEPLALVRCYAAQFRRDEDRQQRALLVHIGYRSTAVVISRGDEPLFVKYLDVGGRHFDEGVSRHLAMEPADAAALRRNNGDRRSEMQDPEIAASIAEGMRPDIERLANELAMCIRYHSVTFRGQPLVRLVLGGGEATPQLLDMLAKRISLKCELSDPFRHFESQTHLPRKGQWDVAVGLALRTAE